MESPTIDEIMWGTAAVTDGDNIVVEFEGTPRKIALIPFEVLEDGLRTSNLEPLANAIAHREAVQGAIEKALRISDWRELVRIDTGQKLFQLWIDRSHF